LSGAGKPVSANQAGAKPSPFLSLDVDVFFRHLKIFLSDGLHLLKRDKVEPTGFAS